MLTQDNKDKIIKITKEHLDKIDILRIVDIKIAEKAETIYHALPEIYKKLSDEKVLPEGLNLDLFMRITLPRLQDAAQYAHIHETFKI